MRDIARSYNISHSTISGLTAEAATACGERTEMKNYFAERRRIGVGIAVVVLLLMVGIHYWSIHSSVSPQNAETHAEAACLKRIKIGANARLNNELRQQMADDKALVAAAANSGGSQPTLDAALARSNYSRTLREVERNRAFCTEYAKCFGDKPFKNEFDACYSVMADKPDQSSDTDSRSD